MFNEYEIMQNLYVFAKQKALDIKLTSYQEVSSRYLLSRSSFYKEITYKAKISKITSYQEVSN